MGERVVVALGGNAILQPGERGTAEEQMENVRKTCEQIARMIKAGYEVVITHGNGPQVGAILLQNEIASKEVPAMPLDICGAESQGLIGYMIQQSLRNQLRKLGMDKEVATIVTQVIVDKDDPAFKNPTKPIGPFYTEEEAKRRMKEHPEEVWIEDSGRGWRRVVPSPDPKGIVEKEAIKAILKMGGIPIASGGGGIPVIYENGMLKGVEAVIDKDLAGERLAQDVEADIFMILTDVPYAYINYRKPDQKALKEVDVDELERYMNEGHFKAGSMGPKVKAVVRFIRDGGKRAIIASLEHALEALEGKAGTQVRG